jgi:hypothetical protein
MNINESAIGIEPVSSSKIIFVDSGVNSYQNLIEDSNAEIVLLDRDRNGIEQITATLANYDNLETIELVSHGQAGSINLGNSQLNLSNLALYGDDLQSWSEALGKNGDILIQGCNAAAGGDGLNFVTQLSELTNADIAASNDLTGSNRLGGDWELEVTTGEIESQSAMDAAARNDYDSLLIAYNDSEYQLTSPGLSWSEAQAEAESLGGSLVSIDDGSEQQWIEDNFDSTNPLWIGYSDRANEGEYSWSNGSTASYTNWLPNQPDDNGEAEDDAVINWNSGDGRWNDVQESGRFSGIIEIGNNDVNPDPEPPVNPYQTFSNGGSEYRLTSSATTWEQAQTEAESLGGDLLTINDVIEKQWVAQTFGNNQQYWIGLNDQTEEGQFNWSSGEDSAYRNWLPNEPNNSNDAEDYTVINAFSGDDRWNDAGTGNFYGIIEIKRNPGEISLEQSNFAVEEDSGSANIEVQRTDGTNGSVTIDYQTSDGSAQADTDYNAVDGTLTFAPGETSQTIAVPIIEDGDVEQDESFNLIIDNVTGGANIIDPRTASITITGAGENESTPESNELLPDLQIIESSIDEGLRVDNTTIPGTVLFRFTTEVANGGNGPLEVWADEVQGNTQPVFQRIYQTNGGSEDVAAGGFSYFEPHGHSHFDDFAVFNLREINSDGSVGDIVATGDSKYSFCLLNVRQPFPELTSNAAIADGRGGDSCGDVQGISVGYSDVYNAELENQWIDITGVADGNYWLETVIDPENRLVETDDENNAATIQVSVDNPELG